MRLKWRVQGCWLDSYGRTWVTCYGPSSHDPDSYAEQYGQLKFRISNEENPQWFAGRLFETEVPFVVPPKVVSPAALVPVPEMMDSLIGEYGEPANVYEEFGNDRRPRRRRR